MTNQPTPATDAIEFALGDLCGLYIDMPLDEPAPLPGDWITTEAGSRYLIETARLVPSRTHAQRNRWQLRVHRLETYAMPPPDVRVIGMRWYRR